MSINNDYTVGILHAQRHLELTAEVEQDRLARLAQGDPTRRWRRWRRGLPATGGARVRGHRLVGVLRHRVAH